MKCKYCDDYETSHEVWPDHRYKCGSKNISSYDDGEGYPPNIKCNNCGYWW